MSDEKKTTVPTKKTTTGKETKPKKHVSALVAASVARSATSQVRRHTDAGLASTGTNVSYEGATAPGGGGSVGTGLASGQEATGAGIASNEQRNVTTGAKKKKSTTPKSK